MPSFLGIDTSNYTSSVATYDYDKNIINQNKKLLPVKDGELGLRQSDAVFAHVKQLGDVAKELLGSEKSDLTAVGASIRPRDISNSYMPCFMVGKMAGEMISSVLGVPFYDFSHQAGHVAAALYSADRMDLFKKRFLAFHLSGGTTEALLVEPDDMKILNCKKVAESLDLKAGQAVDRVGVMLGLSFPAGKELESLSLKSEKKYIIKPVLKDCDCSLSGIENHCKDMLKNGDAPEDIAFRCISEIEAALSGMTEKLLNKYGDMPTVYAGGVMSNNYIRESLEKKFGGIFAKPVFSSDNAAGIAVLTAIRHERGI